MVRLYGGLGAGKSTLARGAITSILKHGGFDVDDIPSPTFTLVQSYPWPHVNDDEREIWHIDLWRLEDPEEVMELGFDEALGRHAMLIEWPERLGPSWSQQLAPYTIDINITIGDDDDRVVTITIDEAHDWADALTQAPHVISTGVTLAN